MTGKDNSRAGSRRKASARKSRPGGRSGRAGTPACGVPGTTDGPAGPEPRDEGRTRNIEEMKALLLGRRSDLLQGMEQNLAYQSSPPLTKGDSSDLAADALDSDTAMQLAESGSSELAQVDEALRKIEEGSYGQCEVCKGDIPWARLEAVPYATLCVSCKEQQETSGSAGTSAAGWSAVDELETLERDV